MKGEQMNDYPPRSNTYTQLESSVKNALGMVAFLEDLTGYGSVSEMVEDWRQTIEETGEYPAWDIEDAEELDADADVIEVLNTWALDYYAVVHSRGPTPEYRKTQSFVIVFSTGGPHIEAEINVSGGVEVRGLWGGERVTLWTRADSLAYYLSELEGEA